MRTLPTLRTTPALWGGLECSVIRIGDRYVDQTRRSGHDRRPEDLERIAALGVQALRYPVVWERTAPDRLATADWSFPDQRLGILRDLGVEPIVGLVHHGSGPLDTSLLDPAFPEKLAVYARAVAERYPWVTMYTPVNEPLTTARFNGLYGHWYPHHRNDASFLQMLLNECRGVALAMQAIRKVNPAARLVQTEDMGKTHSTPKLAYQAWHENERRWLSFDLLCGMVDDEHPLWSWFERTGTAGDALAALRDEPSPPDIFGINHYLTSERFLDEDMTPYPAWSHGGNGRDRYADIEAVRVCARLAGWQGLLQEAWERYQRPIALTEVHLGCTRDEQLRWLWEAWLAACTLRAQGADVRAVTVWSLLGAYDWNSLCVREDDFYEPGAFDLRAPEPRPTAIAAMMQDLAAGRMPNHPALDTPGWWRRPERLFYAPAPGRSVAA